MQVSNFHPLFLHKKKKNPIVEDKPRDSFDTHLVTKNKCKIPTSSLVLERKTNTIDETKPRDGWINATKHKYIKNICLIISPSCFKSYVSILSQQLHIICGSNLNTKHFAYQVNWSLVFLDLTPTYWLIFATIWNQ